jgi:hypothetical protein
VWVRILNLILGERSIPAANCFGPRYMIGLGNLLRHNMTGARHSCREYLPLHRFVEAESTGGCKIYLDVRDVDGERAWNLEGRPSRVCDATSQQMSTYCDCIVCFWNRRLHGCATGDDAVVLPRLSQLFTLSILLERKSLPSDHTWYSDLHCCSTSWPARLSD